MNWLVYALLSAVLQAAATLLQKETLEKGSSLRFSTYITIVKMVLFLPLLSLVDIQAISLGAWGVIITSSILGAAAFVLSTKCLKHMDVSLVAPLFLLSPAIAAIVSFIFLGEKLTLLQGGGIGLLLTGAYFLQTRQGGSIWEPFLALRNSRYLQFLILALGIYGVAGSLDRAAVSHFAVAPNSYMELVFILQAVWISLLYSGLQRGWTEVRKYRFSPVMLVLISALTGGYQYMQIHAVALISVGIALAVKRASAIVITLIGGELFHEKNLWRKTTAALVMVVGVFIMVWHP